MPGSAFAPHPHRIADYPVSAAATSISSKVLAASGEVNLRVRWTGKRTGPGQHFSNVDPAPWLDSIGLRRPFFAWTTPSVGGLSPAGE